MSKTRLKKIIGNPPKDSVVLPASDSPNYYWHLEYLEDARLAWEVYIAVNQVEIIPSLFESNRATLFVGVEQGVFVININTGEIISQVTNTSYVQSIEPILSNYVLVSSEDELIGFASSGNLIWRTTFPDVICDIKEKEDEQIEIEDVSGEFYRLNVVTGKSVMK